MRSTNQRTSLDQRERDAARWRKWNEVRPWLLRCPRCEHEGTVNTTLKRLRASNLICSKCSRPLWRK
jgi:transcription elongation factor Elf1